MNNIHTKFLAILTALFLASSAYSADHEKSISFPSGTNSVEMDVTVMKGDRDVYLVNVRSGQSISVWTLAPEDSATFSVYEPKAENPVPGTEKGNDATGWTGTATKSGEYKIVVEGTKDSVSYKFHVSLK